MTRVLNQTQIVSGSQEQNKMAFDREPISASAMPHRCNHASQPSSASQRTLRPCVYIAFRCSNCGSIRQAVPEAPTQAVIACPECRQECAFVLLGSGLTSRNLPFHQVHIVAPTQWDSPDDDEPDSS